MSHLVETIADFRIKSDESIGNHPDVVTQALCNDIEMMPHVVANPVHFGPKEGFNLPHLGPNQQYCLSLMDLLDLEVLSVMNNAHRLPRALRGGHCARVPPPPQPDPHCLSDEDPDNADAEQECKGGCHTQQRTVEEGVGENQREQGIV